MGRRGAFRAPFWKYFGGRWPPFWVYFGGLGAFWLPSASLGRNREHYPFPGARFWVQVGLQKRAKIDKKSMLKSIKKLMPLWIHFERDFERFWEPEWSHVGTQRAPKMDLILKVPKTKKHYKNQWIFNDSGGWGVQVGSKNR